MLIGLTATPHRKTPEEQIIFRYPLAAAIADRLVKTPVLVGRKDDRTDPLTKLADGIALLERKGEAIQSYCEEGDAEPVQPLMLVIAPDIAEAEEIQSLLQDSSFAEGRYADKILPTVNSKQPDEALAKLEKLEEPGNPYRVVVSVGMLKEGWDVKSVYVICSLRAPAPVRVARPKSTHDRTGAFSRSVGYEGWSRSMYLQAWFDSSTERTVANLLDEAGDVEFFVRLQVDDLPILWARRVAITTRTSSSLTATGIHWVVEVKMDKEMLHRDGPGEAPEPAARRWANHVSADETVDETWRYLLVSEADVKTAKGSWVALRKLGS